jgi:hypothetical protein
VNGPQIRDTDAAKPRALTPSEHAIACLQKAIRHIENGDPNDIRAAWVEIGGARLWTRALHPAPDQAGAMP